MSSRSARRAVAVAAVLQATMLAGCAGVSAVPTSFAVPQSASAAADRPSVFTPVSFPIGVLSPSARPSQTSGAVAWFSPATRSVSIEYTSHYRKHTRGFNVGRGAPHCTRQTNGDVCEIAMKVPASILRFTVRAFDKPLTTKGVIAGNFLGQAVAALSSKTGKIAFSVLGAWRKVTLLSLETSPSNGAPSNLDLKLSVKDIDGYTVYGRYDGDINLSYTTVPQNVDAFKFLVNGKSITGILASSDRYRLIYSGRGILSANVSISSSYARNGRVQVTVTPKASSFALKESPPLSASARVVVPASGIEWFTEPSGKVGELENSAFRETALPSGHTVTMLAWAPYGGVVYGLAFGTAQNTVGLLLPTLEESPAVSGAPIVGVSYYSFPSAPIYVQNNGAMSQYNAGSASSQLVYQAPGVPNLTDLSFGRSGPQYYDGWVFTDAGNDATGFVEPVSSTTFTGTEQPLPAGSGTPAFSVIGEQGVIWTAISGQPKLVIGSTVVSTASEITSMAPVGALGGYLMAATDANGNVEMLDLNGKLLATYRPPDGAATSIVAGEDFELFYVCGTCSQGLHEFLY